MLILHGNWHENRLHLWAESHPSWAGWTSGSSTQADSGASTATHPYSATSVELAEALTIALAASPPVEPGRLTMRLPTDDRGPLPSHVLADGAADEIVAGALRDTTIETVTSTPADASRLLMLLRRRIANATATQEVEVIRLSPSIRFWIDVARLAQDLLVDQRFVPSIIQVDQHALRGVWMPWLHDEPTQARVELLARAMPAAVRASSTDVSEDPWSLLMNAMTLMMDALVREALVQEHFHEAIEQRDTNDPHVALLSGLLDGASVIDSSPAMSSSLFRDTSMWLNRLAPSTAPDQLRLCLQLDQPPGDGDPKDAMWPLSLALETTGESPVRYFAAEIWSGAAYGAIGAAHGQADPAEMLIEQLAVAARINPQLEPLLSQNEPALMHLSTTDAYALLHEHQPVLEEQGIRVVAPDWWQSRDVQLGLRLELLTPEHDADPHDEAAATSSSSAPAAMGLDSLVEYRWQLALGENTLSDEQFASLVNQSSPLVRLDGQWIETPPTHVLEELRSRKDATGEMTLRDAMRHASRGGLQDDGSPVIGVNATGWLARVLRGSSETATLPDMPQPETFVGSLRPYQKRGLSWLVFLDQHGFGACLADDMGLGKTIQLLALLLHERERAADPQLIGPTLLVVPTSVVSNWQREISKFSPSLRALVHHGPDRSRGEAFERESAEYDIVISTYALASRDDAVFQRIKWHRIVLDEAQSIKNPPTKQARAIRALPAPRRVALTGTPLENRLSELWSIMDFCNPGYFGTHHDFQRRLAAPIERRRDTAAASRLRTLVQPFILRRLKTDPTVIDDLPPCLETREFATLTPEQASLYQNVVDSVLNEAGASGGMQRRGMVLAALIKLKQICNHPSLVLEGAGATDGSPLRRTVDRSGKTRRLLTMLEEVIAEGGRALIFTQFRQMGRLLVSLMRSELDIEALFLHGGTPQTGRQQLIDRFNDPDGDVPVFVLSLRAGGIGLNLTAANHVFHFDRWWNPAVEQQATDRAFRIGQTRTVHVHKFVCLGTLEERIDEMIEQKSQLADNIIGSGEQWLTELSADQLRDVLTLRTTAVEEG